MKHETQHAFGRAWSWLALLAGLVLLACGGSNPVLHEVRGPRPVIEDIRLEGVKRFTKEELLSYLHASEHSWLPFTRVAEYDEAVAAVDAQRIEELYQSFGYRQARVISVTPAPHGSDPNRADLVVRVDEGEPTRVSHLDLVFAPSSLTAPEELEVRAAASLKLGAPFEVERLNDSIGDIRISLLGKGFPLATVSASADVHEGARRADVELRITPGVRAVIRNISFEGLYHVPANKLDSKLDLDLTAQLDLDPVKAEARWLAGPLQGELHVENLDLDRLTDDYPGLAMQGIATFSATVTGTTDAPVITAELGARNMTYRTEPVGEVSLGWKLQDGIADWSLRWAQAKAEVLAATLRAHFKTSLNEGILSWLDQEEIKLELHAPKLTPKLLRPFWIAPDDFAFWLSLDADASGPISDLHGFLHAQATVKSGAEPAEPFDMKLALGGALQTLQLELGKQLLNVDLSTNVSLAALRAGTADLSSAAVHGSLRTDLPLQLLAPFIPSWLNGPRGRLVSNVQVTGSLRTPELNGDLRTVNASVAALPLSQRVEQLRIEGKFSGAALELTHLDGVLGTGRLQGNGWGRLYLDPGEDGAFWGGWRVDFGAGLGLNELPILVDGISVGIASAQTTVLLQAQSGRTSLITTLDKARIRLSSEAWPTPSTVPTNPGVRLLDWLDRVKPAPSALAGDGKLHFEFNLASTAILRAPGAVIALGGKLTLDRDGHIARTQNELRVQTGSSFELFGTPFVVKTGVLTLLGGDIDAAARAASGLQGAVLHDDDAAAVAAPLDLILDVVAEGSAVDTRVAAELRGPLRRPELLLASSPELPEYQILTLLVTGRVDSVDERNGEVRRAVARLVEQFHNPSLRRQLFDKLGVDKIGLGFGHSAREPVLTVGRQINRQLYVESVYHFNAPPDENTREGRAEYRFDPRWTVNTAFGDAAEGHAGVEWRIGFGGPKRPTLGDTLSLFGKSRAPTDSDGDGIPDALDKCPYEAEDRDGFQDEDGCLDADDDGDGVLDDRDRAPELAETRNGYRDDDGVPDAAPARVTWVAGKIRTIGLARNSVALTREGQATLDTAERLLLEYPEFDVLITGHSDNRGIPAVNVNISELRARSVVSYLERAGIAPKRLTATGAGSTQPLDNADTDDARSKNRRIEMKLERAADSAP